MNAFVSAALIFYILTVGAVFRLRQTRPDVPRPYRALGYPVLALDVVLLLLIEATVVTSIPAVGTILAVALIVAPAATARLWTERLRATMALSAALGAASGVVGLAISLQWRVAAGATIVLVAAAMFAVSLVVAPRHGLLARAA